MCAPSSGWTWTRTSPRSLHRRRSGHPEIRDWLDATLFNFMIDRAATSQLTEYTKGSYLPLARANEVILKEEERAAAARVFGGRPLLGGVR
jgi:1,2-phenylacetyl-CoA epoxidase catalytic subunit